MDVRFATHLLDALAPRALHDALALRQRVFVVEQDCLYLDIDGHDVEALHVLGHQEDTLVAYARVLSPGARFDVASIGRVVVAPPARGRGVARALMRAAIAAAEARHGPQLALAAQAHLEEFYASLGFVRVGDTYIEDGIPHIDMQRSR